MNKTYLLVMLFLFGISFADKEILAIFEIVPSDNVAEDITVEESMYFAEELRRQAEKILPESNYRVLTRENILSLLSANANKTDCSGDDCALILGKAIGAKYVTQGRFGKFGNGISILVELLESSSKKQLSRIVFESENLEGLLKAIREQAKPLFSEILVFEKLPKSLPEPRLAATDKKTLGNSTASLGVSMPTPENILPEKTTDGILAPGNNLAAKLNWLKSNVTSHNTYVIEVNENESVTPHIFEFKDIINITIILRGIGANRILRLGSNGIMFKVKTNVSFVLDSGITLMGHNQNTGSMVNVAGGTFRMNNGATITGNTGKISSQGLSGAGVYVSSGTFEMNGGSISGNAANYGGGVTVASEATFNMNGGAISGNIANYGGGVAVENGGTFLTSGTITGNVAYKNGGGVWIGRQGAKQTNFNKIGGTITGYASVPNGGNVVKNESGAVIANRGHAIFVNSVVSSNQKRKETSVSETTNLSLFGGVFSGNWDL